MLAGGADALVHREVLTCRVQESRAIIYGTPATLLRGCDSLDGQPFGLGLLAGRIRNCLNEDARPVYLEVNNRKLEYSNIPLIMGILNITPDSFSDGGTFSSSEEAARRAVEMESAGAAIIDIGGESTRPGSRAVSSEEQIERVIPVIHAIRKVSQVPISVDTCLPDVAESAIEAGAGMINSIDGLETPGMADLAVSLKIPVVIMHKRGIPETMQIDPGYRDAPEEVGNYLLSRVEALVEAGLSRDLIIVDPGIGFGKRLKDNLAVIRSLERLGHLTGCRVLLGHSRKSFLGEITGIHPAGNRDAVSHAVTVLSKGADMVRVHDVEGTVATMQVADAIQTGRIL